MRLLRYVPSILYLWDSIDITTIKKLAAFIYCIISEILIVNIVISLLESISASFDTLNILIYFVFKKPYLSYSQLDC